MAMPAAQRTAVKAGATMMTFQLVVFGIGRLNRYVLNGNL